MACESELATLEAAELAVVEAGAAKEQADAAYLAALEAYHVASQNYVACVLENPSPPSPPGGQRKKRGRR